MTYRTIEAPPLLEGAVQERKAVPPGALAATEAVSPVGLPGTVVTMNTGVLVATQSPAPSAFSARTRNSVPTPAARPETVADVAVGAYLHYCAAFFGEKFAKAPKVAAYVAALRARPAFKETIGAE